MYSALKDIELTEEELTELHERVAGEIEERVKAAEEQYNGQMPAHNKNVLRKKLFREAEEAERLALFGEQDWQAYDDADGVPGQRD